MTQWTRKRLEPHSKRVENIQNTLETSGKDSEHTRNEWKRYKNTQNEWKRYKNTLVSSVFFTHHITNFLNSFQARKLSARTSFSDNLVKIHSKRVGKMFNYTQNEWRRCEITLETSGEDVKLHSKRVEKIPC